MNQLLPAIVERLGIRLELPHADIIKQDDPYNEEEFHFYYIGKGECKVRVRDQIGQEEIVDTLKAGEHFGEIGLMYEFKRTASVMSMNYNTFAETSSDKFDLLIKDFPEYEQCLKEHIMDKYNKDKLIRFKLNMIKQIDYLSTAPDSVLYEIMFSVKHVSYEKESIIFNNQSVADSICFIESGAVQVFTKFEGHDFILDTLTAGSIIN